MGYENIHRQNDETDFLSFMNIFPQNTLTKYRNNYEAHNETLWKLWHEDKAGGRSGLFEDGRKIPNDLRSSILNGKNLTHEAYFKIFNVPITNFIYVDIWMYNSDVMGQADYDLLNHITKFSQD